MPLTRMDLGKISLSAVFTTSRSQMLDRLAHLVDDLPPDDEALGRIILVMPDALRRLLEWPAGQTPAPFLMHDAIVFSNPRSRFLPEHFRLK